MTTKSCPSCWRGLDFERVAKCLGNRWGGRGAPPEPAGDSSGQEAYYHHLLINLLLDWQLHGGLFVQAPSQLLMPIEALLLGIPESEWTETLAAKYRSLEQRYMSASLSVADRSGSAQRK